MRYEGVSLARTSAALIAGLAIVVSGCGRLPVGVAPSPVSQVSPSEGTESPAVTTPGPVPTGSTGPPSPTAVVRPSTAPSVAPRPSPSGRASPPPLVIGSLTFPTGEVGIGYPAIALTASGGTPPYTWSISSGELPPPLAVSGSSIPSSTPTAAGPFSFSVKAVDSAGAAAEVAQSITIVPALSVAGTCEATPCSVEQGCDTVCGGFGTQAGGLGPYKYSLSGTLPTGTTLNGLSLAGVFTEVSRAGWAFSVTVTDALGASGGVKAAFTVFPHIAFVVTTANCVAAAAPGCNTQQLTYAGGTPGQDPKVVVSSVNAPNYKNVLPVGFSAVAKGGVVYVSIPAQPGGSNWSGIINLSLVDQSPCGRGYNCSSSNTGAVSVRI